MRLRSDELTGQTSYPRLSLTLSALTHLPCGFPMPGGHWGHTDKQKGHGSCPHCSVSGTVSRTQSPDRAGAQAHEKGRQAASVHSREEAWPHPLSRPARSAALAAPWRHRPLPQAWERAAPSAGAGFCAAPSFPPSTRVPTKWHTASKDFPNQSARERFCVTTPHPSLQSLIYLTARVRDMASGHSSPRGCLAHVRCSVHICRMNESVLSCGLIGGFIWVIIGLGRSQEPGSEASGSPFPLKISTDGLSFPAIQVQSYLAAPKCSEEGLWKES